MCITQAGGPSEEPAANNDRRVVGSATRMLAVTGAVAGLKPIMLPCESAAREAAEPGVELALSKPEAGDNVDDGVRGLIVLSFWYGFPRLEVLLCQ